jgi:uncharacterized protein
MDYTLPFIFIIGFIARLLSNVAGGGAGLIEIPLLLFLGVPPKMTVATRKFAAIGGHAIAAYHFSKAKVTHWKIALTLASIALVAAVIGTNIVVTLHPAFVKKGMAVMMLIALPFMFLNTSFGMKRKVVSTFKKVKGYIFNFIIFMFDAMLGIGGIVSSVSIIFCMGLTYLEVTAIRRITGGTLAIVATIVFMYHGLIDWEIAVILLLGNLLGGHIGAKIAIKKGNSLVKVFFTIFVIASVIKILFL